MAIEHASGPESFLSILLAEVDSSDIWSLVFGDLCISSETSRDSPDEEFSLWGLSLCSGDSFSLVRKLFTDYETGKGVTGRKKYWGSGIRDKLSTSILITERGLFVTRKNLEIRGMNGTVGSRGEWIKMFMKIPQWSSLLCRLSYKYIYKPHHCSRQTVIF